MEDLGPTSKAEAPASAAGYYFQLRYALYRALKRLLRDPTGSIAIERLDDIALFDESGVQSIEQLKHSSASIKMSDNSPAVWRTIGNWARLIENNVVDLATIDLVLVTNASVSEDSALAKLALVDEDRDPAGALGLLISAASSSQNQQTTRDREAFLALDNVIRGALIRAVRVVSDAPSLAALGAEIEDILHYACEKEQLEDFRHELEGWWLERVLSVLSTGKGPIIPFVELDARVDYLREKYKTSSLQFDIDDPGEAPDNLNDYIFVRQLQLVKVGEQRVRNAQRDFLKASAQRSKWLREARIDPAELNKYDNTLQESWSTQAAIIHDELPPGAKEDDNCKSGRQLLGWAETQQTPLRGASAQFLTSGSYHTLADQRRLGWHPNYKKLLGAI